MKAVLKLKLKILSRLILKKYQPVIIGVTGSVGKTSAKEAIAAVLDRCCAVGKNTENINNEFGVPLALVNYDGAVSMRRYARGSKLHTLLFWSLVLWRGTGMLLRRRTDYPDYFVLELSADHPGDIMYFISFLRPYIKHGVVTAVGDVPVHVEFYAGPKAVAKEKAQLVRALEPGGIAALNFDDHMVYEMREQNRSHTLTFGFGEGADMRASDIRYVMDARDAGVHAGLSFKVNYKGTVVPLRLASVLGRHQIYAVLAAACIGVRLGMNLIEIADAVADIQFPPHRMALLTGSKNSLIIDDAYNASPLSTHAALDALHEFGDKVIARRGSGRKVAILGDMSELGTYTASAHRNTGNLAAERCDVLITVGEKARFIADSARNQMANEAIYEFASTEEAAHAVHDIVRENDIVLVKGSRVMEMERIVEKLRN